MTLARVLTIIAGCIIGLLPILNNVTILILGLSKKKYLPTLISVILLVSLIILVTITDPEKEMSTHIAILGFLCMCTSAVYTPIAFSRLIPSRPKVKKTYRKPVSSSSPTDQNLQDIFKEKETPDLKIYINEELEDKLTQLPFISLIDAKKIVDTRMKDGPFTDIKDFEKRMHLSPVILNKIKPHLDFTLKQASTRENPKNVYSRKVDF